MAHASGRIRIAVVDDHEIVRQGLRATIEAEADMQFVGDAGTGDEAVQLCRERRPHVLLLDVRQETGCISHRLTADEQIRHKTSDV